MACYSKALQTLFSSIILIAGFWHVFLKIRERCKNKEIFSDISDKLWGCFKASDKRKFSQRVRRLIEWASKNNVSSFVLEKIKKLREKYTSFTKAYDLPKTPRTTNMVDRLMRPMDK